MLLEDRIRLGAEKLTTGLADGGYYESTGLKECENENITVYVAVPGKSAGIKKRRCYGLGEFTSVQLGTSKHRNGLLQFLMRGLEKYRGEFSLMTTAYNFTRVLNILRVGRFREYCIGRRMHSPQMA